MFPQMKTSRYPGGGSQGKGAARRSFQGPPGLSHIHPSVPEVWQGCVRDPGRNGLGGPAGSHGISSRGVCPSQRVEKAPCGALSQGLGGVGISVCKDVPKFRAMYTMKFRGKCQSADRSPGAQSHRSASGSCGPTNGSAIADRGGRWGGHCLASEVGVGARRQSEQGPWFCLH